MFSKKKKEVIALFYDEKGATYQLIREQQKKWLDKNNDESKEVFFYGGGEAIPSWEAPKIKLDLSQSTVESINIFIEDYLKSSSNIRASLTSMQFPMESLMRIWNGIYKDNSLIQETLLVYQPVLFDRDFINRLPYEQKWVVLTQNIHRNHENMKVYEKMYQEIITHFLFNYLSRESLDKHELIYGEWKEFILKTFQDYYSEQLKIESVTFAIQKTEGEIKQYEGELKEIQTHLIQLDMEYEKASLSQKFKIEELVKETLGKEEGKKKEIKEATEKIERIKLFFEK